MISLTFNQNLFVPVASTSKVSISGKCIQLDSTVSERGYGLAGRVEKIQMTNFMCHSNLEVTFNRRINFVTGRNGSGKSAVMAALIVVLGGSASLTGRGSGVAGLLYLIVKVVKIQGSIY